MLSATAEDQGNYECTVTDHSGNRQTRRSFVRVYREDEAFLRLSTGAYQFLDRTEEDAGPVQWVVQIEAHPSPSVTW